MVYKYDLGHGSFPDPASRFQPEGPHGPSQVVDPNAFEWSDKNWQGVTRQGQVVYEMHIGTFTPEGTWDAAATRLEFLKDLGVTLLEVMHPLRIGRGSLVGGMTVWTYTRRHGCTASLAICVGSSTEPMSWVWE